MAIGNHHYYLGGRSLRTAKIIPQFKQKQPPGGIGAVFLDVEADVGILLLEGLQAGAVDAVGVGGGDSQAEGPALSPGLEGGDAGLGRAAAGGEGGEQLGQDLAPLGEGDAAF